MQEELHRACADYLKSQAGTKRILDGIRQRYIALSGVGGSFVLKAPTKDERIFLRGLLKRDFSEVKQVSVSLKKFEEAFTGTRFEGVTLPGMG